MTAPHTIEKPDFNILMVGDHFAADTDAHTLIGRYLGLETPYGERSMLLRHADGRTSTIPLRLVSSLRRAPESRGPKAR